AARASDPMNLAREGWWKNAEPRYPGTNREILTLLERKGLIKSADEFRVSPEWEQRRDEQRHEIEHPGKNQREDVADELAPQEGESIASWMARLAKSIDTTDATILWSAIRGYVSRFRGDSKAAK